MSMAIIIGILTDTFFIKYIPQFMIAKIDNYYDFAVVMFQIQATVTTLGIALVTLLSSTINDTIYGISISKFILNYRPKFLKQKYVISIMLSMNMLTFVCISIGAYNCVISVFMITFYLILYMTYEILTVFNGREPMKEEINKYIQANLSNLDMLKNIFNDTILAIEQEKRIKVRENLDYELFIFKISEELISNNKIREVWQDGLYAIFSKLYRNSRGEELQEAYLYLDKFYEIIENHNHPEKFVLWDKIKNSFFDSFKYYEFKDVSELNVFASLRWKIYKCTTYDDTEGRVTRNNYDVEYIFAYVYWNIFGNDHKLYGIDKSVIRDKKVEYYKYIRDGLDYDINNNEAVRKIIYNEFLFYTKILIDNCETDVIYKTFIIELGDDYSEMKVVSKNYFLTIIIYVYYLSEEENLVNDRLKVFSKNLILDIQQEMSRFISYFSFEGSISESLVNSIRMTLNRWEYSTEESGKFLIMGSCIDSFLLFSTIYTEYNVDTLKKSFIAIIDTRILQFIQIYTNDKITQLVKYYKDFILLVFDKEINESTAIEDIEKMQNILFDIYRDHELESGRTVALTSQKISYLERFYSEKITKYLQKKFEIFDNNEQDIELIDGSYSHSINTYSRFIKSTIVQNCEVVESCMVTHLIEMLKNNNRLVSKELNYRDKSALKIFFDLLEQKGNINLHKKDLDTLLGYRNRFYGYEFEEKFRQLEIKSHKIGPVKNSNILSYVNSKSICFNSFNVDIKIEEVDFEAIKKSLKTKEGKLLYYVSNNIYVPFDENVLKEHIKNTRKKIVVSISYKYSFKNNLNGIAVLFKKVLDRVNNLQIKKYKNDNNKESL